MLSDFQKQGIRDMLAERRIRKVRFVATVEIGPIHLSMQGDEPQIDCYLTDATLLPRKNGSAKAYRVTGASYFVHRENHWAHVCVNADYEELMRAIGLLS